MRQVKQSLESGECIATCYYCWENGRIDMLSIRTPLILQRLSLRLTAKLDFKKNLFKVLELLCLRLKFYLECWNLKNAQYVTSSDIPFYNQLRSKSLTPL